VKFWPANQHAEETLTALASKQTLPNTPAINPVRENANIIIINNKMRLLTLLSIKVFVTGFGTDTKTASSGN